MKGTPRDAFEDILMNGRDLPWVNRALTDKSYKKFTNQNVPDNSMTNFELATYGDALLKFTLCGLLLDRPGQMSVTKSVYESDRTLVTVIGKHYDIGSYMHYDRDDSKMGMDYNWSPGSSGKEDNHHKHIATAVEAVLGAIYLEHKDMDEIVGIVRGWMRLVEDHNMLHDAIRQR